MDLICVCKVDLFEDCVSWIIVEEKERRRRKREWLLRRPFIYLDPCPSYPAHVTSCHGSGESGVLAGLVKSSDLLSLFRVRKATEIAPVATHSETNEASAGGVRRLADTNNGCLICICLLHSK